MPQKLIIWDFDGVISPTENIWISMWSDYLKHNYNLNLTKEQEDYFLRGTSVFTKVERLNKEFNLGLDDTDISKALSIQERIIEEEGLEITKDIKDIFQDQNFYHCIATGGVRKSSIKKIASLNLENIFSIENKTLFTADMVEKGKPAPDLFLLASKTCGYAPEHCFIIEDSIAGITAGVAANIKTFGFTKYDHNPDKTKQEMLSIGAEKVFDDMKLIHQHLKSLL